MHSAGHASLHPFRGISFVRQTLPGLSGGDTIFSVPVTCACGFFFGIPQQKMVTVGLLCFRFSCLSGLEAMSRQTQGREDGRAKRGKRSVNGGGGVGPVAPLDGGGQHGQVRLSFACTVLQ